VSKNIEQRMNLLPKLGLFLLLVSATGFAQLPFFSVGIKGGVPLTDAFSTQTILNTKTYSDAKNYIVGPTVELKLPFHLSVEADALYRSLNLTTQSLSNVANSIASRDFTSWEFPVVAKYHLFSVPLVNPYVEAGPSFRTVSGSLSYLSNDGITFGAGVDIRALILRLSPEFRYTRWASDSSGGLANAAASNQNQVEFLVGLSF
jgi:hypothetical protein